MSGVVCSAVETVAPTKALESLHTTAQSANVGIIQFEAIPAARAVRVTLAVEYSVHSTSQRGVTLSDGARTLRTRSDSLGVSHSDSESYSNLARLGVAATPSDVVRRSDSIIRSSSENHLKLQSTYAPMHETLKCARSRRALLSALQASESESAGAALGN